MSSDCSLTASDRSSRACRWLATNCVISQSKNHQLGSSTLMEQRRKKNTRKIMTLEVFTHLFSLHCTSSSRWVLN